MTYEQSLKNIELLKNHATPFNCEYLYYDFSSQTDFKLIFMTKNESGDFVDIIRIKFNANLPFAYICITEDSHEVLYYEDEFIHYEFDLTTQTALSNDYKKTSNRCPAQMKLDMARLLIMLKNM